MSAIQHRNILITGASSGIGKATALFLAEKGYFVIGTSRSEERLERLRTEALSRNLAVAAVELDINSDECVEKVIPKLIEDYGTIDGLVNNAGYGLWGPIESLSIGELKAQFETNFFAVARLVSAVMPGMAGQRHGTIINVSSILGRMGTPFNGAYSASKFALEGMSESLRIELGPFGVRVALVEPGLTRTAFQQNQVVAERALSEDSRYAVYVERYNQRHGRFARFATDTVKVAKVIHKILRSRRPGLRYPVGIETRLGVLGSKLLPEKIFQAMVGRATMR